MNQPGEMDLNELARSMVMHQDDHAFELDMNYAGDMEEMDFDLSKKDQDSPENIVFVENGNQEVNMNAENNQTQMELHQPP